MSYKLEKPYTDIQRADFIVLHNHQNGMKIEETEQALFALEPNEIIVNNIPVVNPQYEAELAGQRKTYFEKEFFETSLGWIRRRVNMQDGTKKDFLSDLLLSIKAGLELGVTVEIITYQKPDFTKDITEEYMETLQVRKNATPEFIQECLNQTVLDFGE